MDVNNELNEISNILTKEIGKLLSKLLDKSENKNENKNENQTKYYRNSISKYDGELYKQLLLLTRGIEIKN